MLAKQAMNEKKISLLTYKDKVTNELKNVEKTIENLCSKRLQECHSCDVEDGDSSDSEAYFEEKTNGHSLKELKSQNKTLKICLEATEELSRLQVQNSEVNILVEAPVFEREPPVDEPGTWSEITAECRVDLVPFAISFYAHQPSPSFGATSYRGLQVALTKKAHHQELTNSVLPTVIYPSDVVELLKNYAVALRSRRTTLAKLTEKYSDALQIQLVPDGGYLIKFANVFELKWVLRNKWSPLIPFNHSLKFDFEYMDETYVKRVAQVHKLITDPTIETDERTLLLIKIMNICMEAKGVDEPLENTDSESGMTVQNAENEILKEKNTDKEMMAPPKMLPKKAKPKKDKENIVDRKNIYVKGMKRGNSDANLLENNKKAKIDVKVADNRNSDFKKCNRIEIVKNDKNSTRGIPEPPQGDIVIEKNKEMLKKHLNLNQNINKNTKTVEKNPANVSDKIKKNENTGTVEENKNKNKINKNNEAIQEGNKNKNLIKNSNVATNNNIRNVKDINNKKSNALQTKTKNNKNGTETKNNNEKPKSINKNAADKGKTSKLSDKNITDKNSNTKISNNEVNSLKNGKTLTTNNIPSNSQASGKAKDRISITSNRSSIKASKIPKRIPINAGVHKKKTLRISPRKTPSKYRKPTK